MDLVTLRSLFTVLVFVAFIGVWIWAWSGKRKKSFDEAAQLPFAEDDISAYRRAQRSSEHE